MKLVVKFLYWNPFRDSLRKSTKFSCQLDSFQRSWALSSTCKNKFHFELQPRDFWFSKMSLFRIVCIKMEIGTRMLRWYPLTHSSLTAIRIARLLSTRSLINGDWTGFSRNWLRSELASVETRSGMWTWEVSPLISCVLSVRKLFWHHLKKYTMCITHPPQRVFRNENKFVY